MGQRSAARRTRSALPVVLTLLLAAVGSVLLVLEAHGREVDRTDGAVRAAVAAAVAPTGATIRDQLRRAAAGAAPGDVTVPVRSGVEAGLGAAGGSGPSADALTAARDSGMPVLDEGAGSASIVVPVFRPERPPRRPATAGQHWRRTAWCR